MKWIVIPLAGLLAGLGFPVIVYILYVQALTEEPPEWLLTGVALLSLVCGLALSIRFVYLDSKPHPHLRHKRKGGPILPNASPPAPKPLE